MESAYTAIDRKHKEWRYILRQFFVCYSATTFYFLIGLSLGTPTVAVPQLRGEANSTAAVSEHMASWITSIVPYSSTFWILVLITVAHHFGRKKPMIFISLNSLCAFAVLYYSKNIMYMFISQLIQGVTQASFSTTSNMVVLEYTSPKYRGAFIAIFSATYFWGMWVANAIGTFYNYRYIGLVGIAFSMYNLISLFFIPESPYWLACNNRFDECAKVHRWLKGVDEQAEKELAALIESQKTINKSVIKAKTSCLNKVNKYINILKDPQIYNPILLSMVILLTYHLSGKLVCAVYAFEIMRKITSNEREACIGVLMLDGFSVAGMYLGSILTRYTKRRTLLICNSIICAIFLFVLSIYLHLVNWTIISENSYVSIALLAGFSLAACCGPMSVTSSMYAELYPIKHRSFTIGCMCIIAKIFLGSALKSGPYIFKAFHVHGAFLFFAITFSMSIFLVYWYIPETKDKTMQEISEMFKKKEKVEQNIELERLNSTG